jgi:acetyl-CoA carboxylase biotin carboxyl carrier protein
MPPVKNVLEDSRLSPPVLRARVVPGDDGKLHLLSPAVGLFRGAPDPGALVLPERPIGLLEILGDAHHVLAPEGAAGVVIADPGPAHARRPVAFDEVLLTLDPEAATAGRALQTATTAAAAPGGALVFRAPTSGRFYSRPGPGKPPLIKVGDVVEHGQPVGLIEVMKTFSRLQYGGSGLPPRARIRALLRPDESDVSAGEPLLELEPVDDADPAPNTAAPHPG